MSGTLAASNFSAGGRRIAVVAARFNDSIVAALLKGALRSWVSHGGVEQ